MKRVIVYSKPDCHLCDVVKDVIEHVRRRREFVLEVRNILDDPADFDQYKHGREVARYRITPAVFEAALKPD
jgi:hypothetical protein